MIGRVGAVVESPEVLAELQRSTQPPAPRGCDRRHRAAVDAAIETVKLAGREKDRYRGYSLGMKQRLAIAATLLKAPDLLILDEPTNGLDPAGIREIRETVRDLGESGVTVLLSSHILAEVQQVCTAATIIGNGKLLASGTVDELLGTGTAYRVLVPDPVVAAEVLTRAGLSPSLVDGVLHVDADRPDDITQALGTAGIWLTELTPLRADLEAYFPPADRGRESSARSGVA